MKSITAPLNSSLGKGNWTEQKTQLKAKFPKLTNADLTYEVGNMEAMFTNMEKKLGITIDEISRLINNKS